MKKAASLAVMLLLVLAALAVWALQDPFRGFESEVFYELKRGTSSLQMARDLAALGVVRSPWHFLAARAVRPRVALQAGEYRFAEPATPGTVIQRLAIGDTFHLDITIPEGSNLFEIAELLEQAGLTTAAAFRQAALDPALIRELAPEATSLEGYLYPSTYQVSRKIVPAEFCRRMVGEFAKVWKSLGSREPVHRIVTLASLVEKETAVPDERNLVASVYANRLAVGMKLDCDPTVIYAALLTGRWRGTIYRSDLDRDHPYNTYRRSGLPPGPIANPGEASLRAALYPENTSYLYFVARPGGSGRHTFSVSLAGHERAVDSYRRGLRASNPPPPKKARSN